MNTFLKAFVLLPALGLLPASAQSVSSRLDAAALTSRSAAAAGTLEQSRELSSRSFSGDARFDKGVVDAGGSGAAASPVSSQPTLSASLNRSALGAVVPAPSRGAARSSGDAHPEYWAIGGLLAPVAGAVLGAVVGGVPGAIVGVVAGAAIGACLLLVALAKWMGHLFNP